MESQILCQKIISGGQTGVDRGALDACLYNYFPCGGWCPAGRKAEDGKLNFSYPLTETRESNFEFRTRKNVESATGTLIIAPDRLQGGTLLTREYAKEMAKPWMQITGDEDCNQVLEWLRMNHILILNVAGPRQSEWSKAYTVSYRFISEVINRIRK